MHPRVVGQLRMERDGEDRSLAHGDGMIVDRCEHVHAVTRVVEPRSPDEHRSEGLFAELVDDEIGLERGQLTPKSVAPHADVEQAEMVAVEHDHPGARA